ncbi:hypothetical protein [Pseudonocardia spinosispora]|uniref:hypothetical protein n=1 Tax=Pseudonocardia spinosispora TaxID=103441 RepID=UPI0004231FFC|nr:hypothetical protein [Pseudonocardia spinosispora]
MARHDAEAFHFPDRFDPIPGLYERLQELHRVGRERSALDLVVATLRRDGRSAAAFEGVLLLCSGRTAGSGSGVAEPITSEQLTNPYLAPVATECVSCQLHWFSSHILTLGQRMAVSNPIGLQCQVCRYTLCRDCLAPNDRDCPEPGCGGTLGTPVLPTGRPRRQPANRRVGDIEYVLVLWEGTEPDQAEVVGLLDLVCTWQDRSAARVTLVEDPEVRKAVGEALVHREEREGRVGLRAFERTRAVLISNPRTGKRRVLVVAGDRSEPGRPHS